jgi:hypothetical protein
MKPFIWSAIVVIAGWILFAICWTYGDWFIQHVDMMFNWKYFHYMIASFFVWIVLGMVLSLLMPTEEEKFRDFAEKYHQTHDD